MGPIGFSPGSGKGKGVIGPGTRGRGALGAPLGPSIPKASEIAPNGGESRPSNRGTGKKERGKGRPAARGPRRGDLPRAATRKDGGDDRSPTLVSQNKPGDSFKGKPQTFNQNQPLWPTPAPPPGPHPADRHVSRGRTGGGARRARGAATGAGGREDWPASSPTGKRKKRETSAERAWRKGGGLNRGFPEIW
ncbi:translation initiation factor IF-2-like [Salvia hispanica]|uniref:translation initiation factor IF-2-like n=1 Tax=Salvia hispanica TaxID=49212 RepID=UPI0020099F48|nr:translation initiation factor IF-2-like [Salvia hispanica]